MRLLFHLVLLLLLVLAPCGSWAGEVAATQPAATDVGTLANVPTTRPATFTIRGQLTASPAWDLQKPNLTRAVIYLANDPTLPPAANPLPPATMGQRDKTFVPSFLVIPTGTQVEFPNWDHISHNVFSRSKAAPAFDLERYPYGWSKTRTFDKVGVVQVFCNIHPQMRAVIVVTPNTFFARCDADGRFELPNVPVGRHEIVVWHERCEDQHVPVEVNAGGATDLKISLNESHKNIIANDAPDRRGGYGVERGIGVKREKLDLPVVQGAHPSSQTEPK